MKFKFKKIMSVVTSTLMMGATVALAAAANYPAPFVKNGQGDVAIVTGSGADQSDIAAANAISADLGTFITTPMVPTPTGQTYPLFTSSSPLFLGSSLNSVRSFLTSTELPEILKDGDISGNVDATYTQTIRLNSHPTLVFEKQPKSDDDPVVGVRLGTIASSHIYNMTVTFNKAVAFNHTDTIGEKFNLFGQEVTVGAGTDADNLILYRSAETVLLQIGGSSPNPSTTINVEGKSYRIELLSATSSSATIRVTSEDQTSTQQINLNKSKKILGLEIGVNLASSSQATNIEMAELTIGAQRIKLTNNAEVKMGSDDKVVEGTKVTFTGSVGALTGITIQVAAQDPDKDAITSGNWFVDPVFGKFGIYFQDYGQGISTEEIVVSHSGNDKMRVKFKSHQGIEKNLDWLNNQSAVILADANQKPIIVREWAAANRTHYIVVGNEDTGHLIRVDTILNQTVGHSNDIVSFKDVFSDTTYNTIITQEGYGTVTIGGKEYIVRYYGDSSIESDLRTVRLDYPDSEPHKIILFPTIQTSRGAKLAFYQPTTLNLSDYDGAGTDTTHLVFPNGNGYTTISAGPAGAQNVTVNGFTLSPQQSTNFSVGKLNYNATATGNNNVQIRLISPSGGGNIERPAIIIFEEKDKNNDYNAVIIETEGVGTSQQKVGVDKVGFTATTSYKDLRRESNDDLYDSMDIWGTLVTVDRGDSDQYKATIIYPDDQLVARIYGGEVSGTTVGGVAGVPIVTDTQVSTVQGRNLIVVGGSCINKVAARLLTGSETSVCGSAFTVATGQNVGSGKFLIGTYNSPYTPNKIATLVAGYHAQDTSNAAQYLRTRPAPIDTTVGKKYVGSSATSVTPVV